MMKVGISYYKEQARPIYLIQGTAIRDGESGPIQGKPHAKVVVAAEQSRDGATVFVTLNGWRDKAGPISRVRKMDSLLAVGVLKEKKLGGTAFYDLDVDFVCISGTGLEAYRAEPEEHTLPPGPEQWEDMQHTRALWQRIQQEEVMV